ncbi:MAG TPA: hypothetical protein DEW22_04855 [Clostridiales bacterium]|nr:hypothetical protein [Clostridiales bacterium]
MIRTGKELRCVITAWEQHSLSDVYFRKSKMNDRSISFEKIFNARDMGGLRMAQGRVISSGLLIHSAHLSDSTEADRNDLREKTVFQR